ncbi:MAG: HEAT repeat domain-containing protein, partial [Candidatus Omnitrophica bacterium]|nr:HEAT repeat domain-containing protein [Candidatus Omnitrophota bacterium]
TENPEGWKAGIIVVGKKRDTRLRLIYVLTLIGPDAVEPLMEAIDSENDYVKTCIANALEDIGDPRAVPALIELLESNNNRVVQSAAKALGTMPDPRAGKPLTKLIKNILEDEERLKSAPRDSDLILYGASRALYQREGQESIMTLARVLVEFGLPYGYHVEWYVDALNELDAADLLLEGLEQARAEGDLEKQALIDKTLRAIGYYDEKEIEYIETRSKWRNIIWLIGIPAILISWLANRIIRRSRGKEPIPDPDRETTEESQDATWRGISIHDVKSILYPACGTDADTVVEMLNNLPDISDIHLNDDTSTEGLTYKWIKQFFYNKLEEISDEIEDTEEYPTEENRDVLMLRVRKKGASGWVNVHFHWYDYLQMEAVKGLEEGSDLTIVKNPGLRFILTTRTFNKHFYGQIYRHTKKYIYITVADPPLDKKLLKKLKILDYRLFPLPWDKNRKMQKKSARDLSKQHHISHKEYVVCQKKELPGVSAIRRLLSRLISRRNVIGLLLLAFVGLCPASFGDQRIYSGSVIELGVQEKTRNEIRNLIFYHVDAIKAGLLDHPLVFIEDDWDTDPRQISIIRRGLQDNKYFRFGDGLIYHGNDNLDKVLLANKAEGELFFTRVAHEWATGFFSEESKSPAIFVMDTQDFNDLVHEGVAELNYTMNKLDDLIDPYPHATSFSLNEIKEIWVSEDTYERYKRIINATSALDLPIGDRALMSAQDTLRHFLETDKIKKIPGLHHLQLPNRTRQEGLETYVKVHGIVGNYMRGRKLFQQIPFFEIEGEPDVFAKGTKKPTPSVSTGKTVLPPQKLEEKSSKTKWILGAAGLSLAAALLSMSLRKKKIQPKPQPPKMREVHRKGTAKRHQQKTPSKQKKKKRSHKSHKNRTNGFSLLESIIGISVIALIYFSLVKFGVPDFIQLYLGGLVSHPVHQTQIAGGLGMTLLGALMASGRAREETTHKTRKVSAGGIIRWKGKEHSVGKHLAGRTLTL